MAPGRSVHYWKGPGDISLTQWNIKEKVKDVTQGLHHTALLTENGRVYCCGSNNHGQLGVGDDTSTSLEPLLVEFSCMLAESVHIDCVAVGLHHTICGTKEGYIFCWGNNTQCQCGGSDAQYNRPHQVIQFESPVVKVTCSHLASFALLENGQLYAWGTGRMLNDLHLANAPVKMPRLFAFIEDRFVMDVSCGSNFVIVVLKKSGGTSKRRMLKTNSYVVVHKGDSPPKSEVSRSRSSTMCPLGLEVHEEHVFIPNNSLPSSANTSPSMSRSVKKFTSPLARSYNTKSEQKDTSSSQDSLNTQPEESEAELISMRTRASTIVHDHPLLNVDKIEAKRWFSTHIGEDFDLRLQSSDEGDCQPTSSSNVPVSNMTSYLPARTLQPLVTSVWKGISTSSQAVTQAVQGSITSITGKMVGSEQLPSTSNDPASFGLQPFIKHERRSRSSSNASETSLEASSSMSSTIRKSTTLGYEVRKRPGLSHQNKPVVLPTFQCTATIDTEVWSWGSGSHGQLGHNDCLDRLQPQIIAALENKQIFRVYSSDKTTLAHSSDGKIYSWGDNTHKQITHDEKPMISEPIVLTPSEFGPVCRCSIGSEHTLLLIFMDSQQSFIKRLFYLGKSCPNSRGMRLSFINKLGDIFNVSAGFNDISCCVTDSEQSDVNLYRKHIDDLIATEVNFYRFIKEMCELLVDPIVQSDFMKNILSSVYGDCLRDMFEQLYLLIDQIGVSTQSLLNLSNYNIKHTLIIGDQESYMNSFINYSQHYHNFLAMNGLTYLIKTTRITLLNHDSALSALLDKCGIDYEDDLEVKVARLLQLPLRRISEYHSLLELIQLNMQEEAGDEYLITLLGNLEQKKSILTSHYQQAESTRIFWERCPHNTAEALREPSRRIIRDSKSLPLSLVGGNKLQSNWFALFNDIFVHIQGSVHRIYPLETLWVEASEAGSTRHEIKLIMPEANLVLSATNSPEKIEWTWVFNQTISAWLASLKTDTHNSTTNPISTGTMKAEYRTPPLTRVASHKFYKNGSPLHSTVYKGQWNKGMMNGEGELLWPNGATHTGTFVDGRRTGYGKYVSKRGTETEIKDGHWFNGKIHGFAKVKYFNGDSYNGFMKNDLAHGHGTFKCKSNSSVYIGEWKDGKKHGYGVLDLSGEKYMGEWCNDQRIGSGIQVTLDCCYIEGTFYNNKLTGQGLIMTSDNSYYEGQFVGGNEIQGKGTMYMSNGDSITGYFDGTFASSIKISNGVYQKNHDTEKKSTTPNLFGTLSTPADKKWVELFNHSSVALGVQPGQPINCDKAWEKLAVLMAQLKQSFYRSRKGNEFLERIPTHNAELLTMEHYNMIRKYVLRAGESDIHPLGLLMKSLITVYRSSYSGTGTHPRLLLHAIYEVKSLTYRYYELIRVLFPELPEDSYARKVYPESYIQTPPNSPRSNTNSTEKSETITPTSLIFPLLLPKIYEPLFYLFVMQHEDQNDQYWNKIQRFNKQSDLTLLSYLGVNKRFWFLGELKTDYEDKVSDIQMFEVRELCYTEAIENLQKLSTCLTPGDKLATISQTFAKIDKMVQERMSENKFVWNMDDLIPVFLFVVIRSRLRYLGSEIQFIEDLMDRHHEYGELGLMFTTLKACYIQILTEKVLL